MFTILIKVDVLRFFKLYLLTLITIANSMGDSERTHLLSSEGPDLTPRVEREVPRGNASADPSRHKVQNLHPPLSSLDSVEVPNNPEMYMSNSYTNSQDSPLDRLKIS